MNTVVRYIPDKENILSDFVSRNIKEEEKSNVINVAFIELNMASYTKEDLLEKQFNDQEINKVLKYLNEEESYKKFIDKLVLNDNLLFVCPEEIRGRVTFSGTQSILQWGKIVFNEIRKFRWW